MRTFITSSSLCDVAFGKVQPILHKKASTSNSYHKFIERYFPRDEQQVTSLLAFRKKRKQSNKLRMKKRPPNDDLLQVA